MKILGAKKKKEVKQVVTGGSLFSALLFALYVGSVNQRSALNESSVVLYKEKSKAITFSDWKSRVCGFFPRQRVRRTEMYPTNQLQQAAVDRRPE